MPNVAIVTDSTADLSPAECALLGITVVPLNVHFGAEQLRDQVDISTERFMDRLANDPTLPSTSSPPPAEFARVFRALAADHDEVVAVLLSSRLSGAVDSARLAATDLCSDLKVEVVDSANASLGLGFQVLRAAGMAHAGHSAAEIARTLRAEAPWYHVVFFVDDLTYLERGGRIGRAASLVSSVLKLKPVLRIDEGAIVPHERTRTRARAVQSLSDFVHGFPDVARLGVLYTSDRKEAEALAAALTSSTPIEQAVIARLSPVLGTHVGPGVLGVCVVEPE